MTEKKFNSRLEIFTWFYEKTEAYKNGPLSFARDAGFELLHTGGGCLALTKDYDDKISARYLITTQDGGNIDAGPNDREWVVGLYVDYKGGESWTFVSEPVTLQEVLDRYERIPFPCRLIKASQRKWSLAAGTRFQLPRQRLPSFRLWSCINGTTLRNAWSNFNHDQHRQ